MRTAQFYYAVRDNTKALQQTSLILDETDAEDDIVFDWYNDKKLPITEILLYGMPAEPRALQAYLRHLMNLENIDNAAVAWNRLLSRGEADNSIAIDYTNFLFREQKYENAAQAWARYLGKGGNGYLVSNWIYNGDFENEPSGSPFDWHREEVGGVDVTSDRTIVHSGARSLRIHFDGRKNLTYNHVSDMVFVRPGAYKFQAYLRCRDITPDQGVGFHIFDPETPARVNVKTEQLVGTKDWEKVGQVIPVPPGTRLLQVQIIRQPSWKLFNNKTTGTAWIDGVKLIKLD